MREKIILIFLIILCIIFASGCWDRVEIERNAFILGLGIDLGSDDNSLIITYQVATLEAFKGEGGGNTKSTEQISIESDSLSKATNSLLRHFGNVPNFTHCKLIVFGEEYARKGIRDSLDYLFRETQIRRLTSVCVAQGQAREVLNSEPKTAPSSAMIIDQIITRNSIINSEIFPFEDVGYIHQNFIRGSDITLVRVIPKKDTIEVSGAGAFKDHRLIGWYTGSEVTGQRFIIGEIEKGLFTLQLPWEKGGKITLNAYNINVSTIPQIQTGDIVLKNKILVEGDIDEVENSIILHSEELLNHWKKAVKDHISSTVNSVYKKGRDIYGVDSFEIDEKMEGYYPEFWEKHKDEWNEIFKTVTLDLDIEVKIRRVGVIEH